MVLNKYYLHLNTFQLHRIMTSAIFFLQAATLFWSAYRYFYATQQRWFQLPSFPSISFILLLPQTLEFKSKRQSSNCVWTQTHTHCTSGKGELGQHQHSRAEVPDLRAVRLQPLGSFNKSPRYLQLYLEHAPVKTDSLCLLSKGRVKAVSVCILKLEFFIFCSFLCH